MKLKFIPIAFMSVALVACGGGGGGSSSPSPNPNADITPPITSNIPNASTLSVTAKVNGVVVPGYPATAASAPAITVISGQELEVTSSMPTAFGGNLNNAVAAVRTDTPTTYKAVLAAPNETTATLTFTTTSTPFQTRTILVTVKAVAFEAVVPKVGDSFVYGENDILVNKNSFKVENVTQRVAAVNADGTWIEEYLNSANALIGTATYTKQGNRTSFRNDAASNQTCNNKGNKLSKYSPEEKLLSFPLVVGATFEGSWTATCGTDTVDVDSQLETINARVVGYESVTTAAGVFNALRIDETTTVTKSTNTAFPGGGYSQTVSVWFDPVLGRNIKFLGTRSYLTPPTPSQAASLVETTNIELVSYVKN